MVQPRNAIYSEVQPCTHRQYRVDLAARIAILKNMETMLQNGVNEPAKSRQIFSFMLVSKLGDSWLFSNDHCRLNAIMTRDTYPNPRMHNCVDFLVEATQFSTLDANSGYWRALVA